MDMHHLELDIGCYAAAVYHESNTQSLQEKLGVLNVVRNRLKSGRWGNNVCSWKQNYWYLMQLYLINIQTQLAMLYTSMMIQLKQYLNGVKRKLK